MVFIISDSFIRAFYLKVHEIIKKKRQSSNSLQKIRKILRAVSEKTALQTNQPTNQPNIDVSVG